jgi:hypothetical protein
MKELIPMLFEVVFIVRLISSRVVVGSFLPTKRAELSKYSFLFAQLKNMNNFLIKMNKNRFFKNLE